MYRGVTSMNKHNVVIYTSDNCTEGKKVIENMEKWEIGYTIKNISDNKEYLTELQNRGVFGTPATFVDDYPVLGYQENKLKNILDLSDSETSYFRNFYEGYQDQ